MFKFVSDNVGGIGTKRKLSQKPCESCKKRHKRCPHVQPDMTPASLSQDQGNTDAHAPESSAPDSPSAASAQIESPTRDRPRSQQQGPPTPVTTRAPSDGAFLRFVGDLKPEASFLIHGSQDRAGNKRRAEVGVWLGQKPDDRAVDDQADTGFVTVEPNDSPAFRLSGLAGLKALHPYLRRECMSVLPPDYEYSLMAGVYFAKFDPIFPILHDEKFDGHDAMDRLALKQCICLVAASDPSLRPHLRLPHTQGVLSQADFRASVALAVKQSLDSGFIRDKMVVLQVTVIMAFYADSKDSSEVSSFYAAQAVCHSQTMALHLGWPKDGNSTARSRRIFWCVWTLDRLSAATNGRAIVIHHQDIDDRVWEAVDEQIPAFRLFIRISRFFDETIALYRPRAVPRPPGLPPSFEDLVCEAKATDLAAPLLVSLELFYLAVVILQSGPERTGPGIERTPSSSLRIHSATSIVDLASKEFKSSMSFFATLPYALSLACSVAYESLRSSKVTYKRMQAYALFHSSCDVLDELSRSFASTQSVTKLAKETLQEMERVSASRNKGKSSDNRRDRGSAEAVSAVKDASAINGNGAHQQEGTVGSTSRTETPASRPADFTESYPPGDSTVMGALDPAIFAGMDFTDVGGIFEDFDPNFQLNRVDAVFSANLNPTMPLFPIDWLDDGQYGGFP